MRSRIISKISAPVLAFLALIIFGATYVKATPGELDLTFSLDGKLTDVLGRLNAVAIQPDGKIVVAGRAEQSLAIERYNAEGSPSMQRWELTAG